MGFNADACPNPWAVVVHSEDTFTTNRAVMGPWWLQTFAFLAVPVLHQVLKQIIVWKHRIVILQSFCQFVSAVPLKLVAFHERPLWIRAFLRITNQN